MENTPAISRLLNDIYNWDTKSVRKLSEKIIELKKECRKINKYEFEVLDVLKIPVNDNYIKQHKHLKENEEERNGYSPRSTTLYSVDAEGFCLLEIQANYSSPQKFLTCHHTEI